jgi:hypothetical protein
MCTLCVNDCFSIDDQPSRSQIGRSIYCSLLFTVYLHYNGLFWSAFPTHPSQNFGVGMSSIHIWVLLSKAR